MNKYECELVAYWFNWYYDLVDQDIASNEVGLYHGQTEIYHTICCESLCMDIDLAAFRDNYDSNFHGCDIKPNVLFGCFNDLVWAYIQETLEAQDVGTNVYTRLKGTHWVKNAWWHKLKNNAS
jgi:hypothetical protein